MKFKQALAATSGTILQWYDFSLFGFLAPTIANLFFPESSPTAALLLTFGIFSVSYLLAPLGSALFGYIGDNYGRKKALTMTILAMTIPTALISILPSYQQIGLMAAILLTVLRIIQGLSASSEYPGAAIFLVEHAPATKKCFYGSLPSSAYSVGCTLAGVAASFATMEMMPSWGWRLPFALAILGGILAYYMRKNLVETPEFKQLQQNPPVKANFIIALKKHPLAVVCTAAIGLYEGIITFGSYVFATSYLNLYAHLPLSTAITITSLGLMTDALLEPLIAILADRWGKKIISLSGMLGYLIFAYPIFQLLSSGNIHYAFLGMIALSALIALSCAPLNALMISLFPPDCRYSGFAVSFNTTVALCAMIPLLMTWLISYSHNILAPALCYMIGAMIGLIALQKAKANEASYITAIDLLVDGGYSVNYVD